METTLVTSATDSFLFLGQGAIKTVLPFFELFKNEKVAPTIAVLMVAFAIFLGFWFAYIIWKLKRDVDKRLNFTKGCQNRQDFFSKFDEFDALMVRSKLLKHSWDEYKETMLLPKANSTIIESTVRPGEFINLTELEHSGLKLKWFHAIPGIFVGVGLLFTFIGLVAALFFASQAIHAVSSTNVDAAQQTAEMQKALAQLLGAATFKFWTSIAGLGCSIALGMFYRHRLRRLDGALDALCRGIERCTRTVTPELIANRQLEELREQSAQLKEFTGQLAFNLGRALEDALNKAMPDVITSAMSPLGNGVADIINSIRDLHQSMPSVMGKAILPISEGLNSLTENMAKEFGSAVSEQAGAEIKVASSEMATVAAALQNASEHIIGSGNGLSGQIAEAANDMHAAAKAITEGMSSITNTVRADVDRTRDTLEAQLQTAMQGLSSAAEVIRASLADVGGKLRSTSEEAGAVFFKQIAEALTRIENSTQSNTMAVQQALTQLRDMTTNATASMATETNTVIVAMRDTCEQMTKAVAEITTRIRQGSEEGVAELTERLVKAAEAMQEASNNNSERIGQAVEQIIAAGNQAKAGVDKATDRAAKDMEAAGKQAAGQVIVGAEQVLADFKGSVNDFSDRIRDLRERLNQVSVAMDAVEGRIGSHVQVLDAVNIAAKETEGSLSSAAFTLVEAGKPLNQATQALQESIERSSCTVQATTQALEETQRQSTTLSEEMSNTLAELQGIWNRHMIRFDMADENLGKAVGKIMDIVDWNTTKLDEQVKAMDSGLAQAVGTLAGNIGELEETAQEFHEATLAFSEATKSLEKVASRQTGGYR